MHTMKEFHDMLRHTNNHAYNITLKSLEYKHIGKMNGCEDCTRFKQKKKSE